jgi:hypothetical protein
MTNGNPGKFERAVDTFTSFEQFCQDYRDLNLSPPALRRMFDKLRRDKLYLSEQYQVAIDKDPDHNFVGMVIWHLSVKRLDKEPIMDWRDLQAIKSQLCGAEAEAIQLFPAESRVVDTSNQYHLWVFMKLGSRRLPKVPVGWTTKMVLDETATGKAKQRPLDDDPMRDHHERLAFAEQMRDEEDGR